MRIGGNEAAHELDVPIDRDALRERVRATLTRLSRTGELPALAPAAAAAMAIARDPNAGVNELCRVIRGDVGLSARIVRLANSASYARRLPARTLEDAVLTIGLRKTCDLMVAASARQLFRHVPRHAEALWNHALASALVGEEIARITRRVDPRGVFLPALFHDVGRIAFLIADAAAFETLHQRAASGGAAFAEVERTWFGFDHAEAGAILAEDWGLAPDQCEGVRWHHRPAQADVGQALAALLSAADTAAFAMGCESIGPQPEDVGSAVLGLDPESVAGCVDRTRESFAEQRALLD